jgi:hypothetical protein
LQLTWSIATNPLMRQQKVIDPISIVTLPIPDVLRRLAFAAARAARNGGIPVQFSLEQTTGLSKTGMQGLPPEPTQYDT